MSLKHLIVPQSMKVLKDKSMSKRQKSDLTGFLTGQILDNLSIKIMIATNYNPVKKKQEWSLLY